MAVSQKPGEEKLLRRKSCVGKCKVADSLDLKMKLKTKRKRQILEIIDNFLLKAV